MKHLKFTKMHGLGNDFVVIDGISQAIDLSPNDVRQLAHRYVGVGCDQVLLIKKSSKADFACVIYNADGSSAEQCGNGMRCVARFVHENKLIHKKVFTIETPAGILPVLIHDYDNIEVDMGIPIVDSSLSSLTIDDGSSVELTAISMGNPHVVIAVDALQHFPVAKLGAKISTHSLFEQGTNVGFMQIVDAKHIHLRTYERGVGETFACGSNACAAVVAGILARALDHEVKVALPFGELTVRWNNKNDSVILAGAAVSVFAGQLLI